MDIIETVTTPTGTVLQLHRQDGLYNVWNVMKQGYEWSWEYGFAGDPITTEQEALNLLHSWVCE